MNFILRGILTLKEKKGRAIILLCIMLTVCVVMLSSFAIQSGADASAVLAREKLGAEVTITQNMENMMKNQRAEQQSSEDSSSSKRLKFEQTYVPIEYAEILSENEHVTGYLESSQTTANLTDLLPVGEDEEDTDTSDNTDSSDNSDASNDDKGENGMDKGGDMGGGKMMMGTGDVTIKGVNNYLMSEEYVDGEVELTDGREITEDDLGSNVVMVESTFAEENDIQVGDTFSIESVSFGSPDGESDDSEDEDTTTIEVEVVGIYTSSETVDSMGFKNTASLPYNTIYAPYTLVSTLNGDTDETGVDSIKFYLDDPNNVDEFVEYAEGLDDIDTDTYSIDSGSAQYESMIEPIENIASFSKTTIIVVTIFGGAILALIVMLSIKSRINEIGMFMALGEKRIKIIGQLLIESLVTLVVAFGISIALSGVITDKVADKLLQNELTTTSTNEASSHGGSQSTDGNMGDRPSGGNMPGGNRSKQETTEKISEMNVSISGSDVMSMAGLSVLVVIVATALPSIIIMRYNPKKILSSHS